MPIHTQCPNGHALTTGDAQAGKTIQCPRCQAVVAVPALLTVPPGATPPTAAAETDEYQVIEPAPAPPDVKVRPMAGPLRWVRLGLGFHYAKLLTILIGILLAMVGLILAAFTDMNVVGIGARLVVIAAWLDVSFGAPVLGLVGSLLCCRVPCQTRGRPLIVTALALETAALAVPILLLVVGDGAAALRADGAGTNARTVALGQVAPVCTLVGFVLFMLFLRRLAFFLEAPGAAEEAVTIIYRYLLLYVVAPVALAGLALAALTISSPGNLVALVGVCVLDLVVLAAAVVWVIYSLSLMFRTLNLIGSLRQALRRGDGVRHPPGR
jgi:hypothetical protein